MHPLCGVNRTVTASAPSSSDWRDGACERAIGLMPLNIETFNNAVGGNAFYKAVTHPLAADAARALLTKLRGSGAIAIYDPHNLLAAFDAVFPLDRIEIAGLFVQDVSNIGRKFRDKTARPITELPDCHAQTVLIAGFDTALAGQHIKPLVNGAA